LLTRDVYEHEQSTNVMMLIYVRALYNN